MSLRARMGLAGGLAVAVAVIAVAVSAYAGTSSQLHGQLDQSLRSLNAQVLGSLGLAPGGRPSPGTQGPPGSESSEQTGAGQAGGGFVPGTRPRPGSFAGDPDEGLGLDRARSGPAFGGAKGVVTLVKPDGTTYSPRGQIAIPASPQFKAIAARGHGTAFATVTVSGAEIRVLATGIGRYGAMLVALPLHDVNHALGDQLLLLVIIALGGIALAGVLGVLVARTALAPIARFTRQTEAIAARPDRLDRERLDVRGHDELARLGATFNRTLDALESSVQAQRNLVADASHELRTPIATIRANLQLMRDEQLLSPEDRQALRDDVIEELDELTALVGDVVELARGTKLSAEPAEVRVDEIVTAAVDRARRRWPELTVTAAIEPTLVRGEGDRVARAVANLLDNAAKYGGAGGSVELGLSDGVLTVRDHGPGFQDDDLPFVFDRFHRAADARGKPGSGLGLAIVRQAAEAHGGFVEAANAPGGGALMRISFGPTLQLGESALPDAVGSP